MIEGINVPTSRTALRSFNKLISAAETMFYTKGYFNTTINDIVNQAGVSTGTFYIYFESKYPVYEFIMKKYESELKSKLAQAISGCANRLETEIAGIRAFVVQAYKNPTCYNLIWESLYINKDLFYDYYKTFAASYVRGLKRAEAELVKDLDLETLAYCLMGISNFVGLQAITRSHLTTKELDAMCNTIRIMLKNGVFNQLEAKD